MSGGLTSKTSRITDMSVTGTAESLGPGRYHLRDPSSGAPSWPPFNAHAAKELNPNTTTSAITPGPGAYVSLPESVPVDSLSSFGTTGPRTASIIQNSSPFQEWTGVNNPGPGSYDKPSALKVAKEKPRPRTQGGPSLFTPPTIPSRAQGYGYTTAVGDDVVATAGKGRGLKVHGPPDAATRTTGVGSDTVGPGKYDIDIGYAAVTTKKQSAVDFRKQAPRKAMKSFADTVPGPGQYELSKPASPDFSLEGSALSALSISASLKHAPLIPPSPVREVPVDPIAPDDAKRYHSIGIVPNSNLPNAGGSSKGGFVVVPDDGDQPRGRNVGTKPWSKPDFYFRSQAKESAVFASRAPGPGEVLGVQDAPGSHTGKVIVGVTSQSSSRPITAPVEPSLSSLQSSMSSSVAETLSASLNTESLRSSDIVILKSSMPGPGSYDTASKYAGKVVNASSVSIGSVMGSGFDFGTKDARGGWDKRTLESPFVDNDIGIAPGPGAYNPLTSSLTKPSSEFPVGVTQIVDGRLKHIVKSASAPFFTSTQRYCLRDDVNDAPGGPAEYATTALALSASIKKSGANKHGTSSFVNNAKRSEMASKLLYDVGESGGASWGLSGADGVSSHDRPDSHKDDTDLNRVGTRKPLSRKGLSSFASTSLRSELASKALPADVAPGSYEVTPTWSAASPQKSLPVHKYKVNPKSMTALIPASKPNKDYLTSQKRFYRRIPEETPGPGAYDPNASSAAAKSVPIEVRFQRGLGDYLNSKSVAMAAAKVGPGSYSIGGSMVKKSFNVNFAQE